MSYVVPPTLDIKNQCWRFDNDSSPVGRLYTTSASWDTPTGDFTFGGVFRTINWNPTGDRGVIIGKDTFGAGNHNWALYSYDSGTAVVSIYDSADNNTSCTASLTEDELVIIVGTYDKSETTLTCWKNGALANSDPAAIAAINTGGTAVPNIASSHNGWINRSLTGDIHCTFTFDRLLSQSEVEQLSEELLTTGNSNLFTDSDCTMVVHFGQSISSPITSDVGSVSWSIANTSEISQVSNADFPSPIDYVLGHYFFAAGGQTGILAHQFLAAGGLTSYLAHDFAVSLDVSEILTHDFAVALDTVSILPHDFAVALDTASIWAHDFAVALDSTSLVAHDFAVALDTSSILAHVFDIAGDTSSSFTHIFKMAYEATGTVTHKFKVALPVESIEPINDLDADKLYEDLTVERTERKQVDTLIKAPKEEIEEISASPEDRLRKTKEKYEKWIKAAEQMQVVIGNKLKDRKVKVPISKDLSVREAIARLFGVESDTVTYEMFKYCLELRSKILEEQRRKNYGTEQSLPGNTDGSSSS